MAPLTRSGKKLDEFSMVFYNNLLSLPLLCLVAAVNGEFVKIANEPAVRLKCKSTLTGPFPHVLVSTQAMQMRPSIVGLM